MSHPEDKQNKSAERPSLLQPPATVISPPSPTDTKDQHPPRFEFSPHPPSPAGSDDSVVEYDSPEEEEDLLDADQQPPQQQRPRASSSTLSPAPNTPVYLSRSPKSDSSLMLPDSPDPSGSKPRSPSPSSPRFRPRGAHHRRTSSTHRVRETTDGHQTSTSDGDRMINQYKIGKSLGRGAYAKVELAVDVGTGNEYAIKEFSKSRLHYQALQEKHRHNTKDRMRRLQGHSGPLDDDGKPRSSGANPLDSGLHGRDWAGTKTIEEDPLGLVRREIAIMKKLDHPNIVHLYEAISVPTADALFLVLDYMPGGTLMEVHMGQDDSDAHPPFSLEQTREYFRQLCLGLEYLHANEIIHRDVKPDNVLLSADRQLVKLCDFGVSEMFVNTGDDRIKNSGGSPAFLSPESFTNQTHELHGKAVDIWALGVTLYCMLTGTLPFNLFNPLELFTAVREKEPKYPSDWEPALHDLMEQMFCKDPQKRIVMAKLREHPWVTENGENPMIETEDNLFELGKHVEEPTQEELSNAFTSLRGIFTVVRAVQKMRRLHLRRSVSGQGRSSSPGGSMDQSTNASLASGSMDSYASHGEGAATDATSVSEDTTDDAKYSDIAGDRVSSPRGMSTASPTETERQGSNPPNRPGKIDTSGQEDRQGQEEEGVSLVDSPVSEGEDQSTPVGSGSN